MHTRGQIAFWWELLWHLWKLWGQLQLSMKISWLRPRLKTMSTNLPVSLKAARYRNLQLTLLSICLPAKNKSVNQWDRSCSKSNKSPKRSKTLTWLKSWKYKISNKAAKILQNLRDKETQYCKMAYILQTIVLSLDNSKYSFKGNCQLTTVPRISWT